jgi:hypothetical protein
MIRLQRHSKSADAAREAALRRVAQMTARERILLALRLGRRAPAAGKRNSTHGQR